MAKRTILKEIKLRLYEGDDEDILYIVERLVDSGRAGDTNEAIKKIIRNSSN